MVSIFTTAGFDASGNLGERSRQGFRRARNLRFVLRYRRLAGKHGADTNPCDKTRDC